MPLQPGVDKQGTAVVYVDVRYERKVKGKIKEGKQRCKFYLKPNFQAKLPERCQRCA